MTDGHTRADAMLAIERSLAELKSAEVSDEQYRDLRMAVAALRERAYAAAITLARVAVQARNPVRFQRSPEAIKRISELYDTFTRLRRLAED